MIIGLLCGFVLKRMLAFGLIFLELIENRCKKYQPDWEMSDQSKIIFIFCLFFKQFITSC